MFQKNRYSVEIPPFKFSRKRSGNLVQWRMGMAVLLLVSIGYVAFQSMRPKSERSVRSEVNSSDYSLSSHWQGNSAQSGVAAHSINPESSGRISNFSYQPIDPLGRQGSGQLQLPEPDQLANDLLLKWYSAWSDKDFDSYIVSYSANYAPPGMSRAQWLKKRHAMITGKKFISIHVSDIQAHYIDGQLATSFEMVYTSDSFVSTSRKELIFTPESGQWRIVREINKDVARLSS